MVSFRLTAVLVSFTFPVASCGSSESDSLVISSSSGSSDFFTGLQCMLNIFDFPNQ